MTRQQMYYFLTQNNVVIDECNLSDENTGNFYYLSIEEMEDITADIIEENREKERAAKEERKTVILKGDKITAYNLTFTVDRILYQEYWKKEGFDCEFIDTKGNYHHWKQWQDGGNVSRWNGRVFETIG